MEIVSRRLRYSEKENKMGQYWIVGGSYCFDMRNYTIAHVEGPFEDEKASEN